MCRSAAYLLVGWVKDGVAVPWEFLREQSSRQRVYCDVYEVVAICMHTERVAPVIGQRESQLGVQGMINLECIELDTPEWKVTGTPPIQEGR